LRLTLGYELRIDLRQWLVGSAPLRGSLHDGSYTIAYNAIASLSAASFEARLSASSADFSACPLAGRRLSGEGCTRYDEENHKCDDRYFIPHRDHSR
jgi:hypothetical protein